MAKKEYLQIGEVAQRAGTTVRTVRYYLELGLIQAESRSKGGFYLFSAQAADTVYFIQKLRSAGLGLRDIQAVYEARRQGDTGNEASSEVLRLLQGQKEVLEQKIQDYQRLLTEIQEAMELASYCQGCSCKPSRQTCLECSVLKDKQRLPLPIQAIL
ncbi:MAG: MerR family transcriptional regulator [Thermodesulfobacteriota bacterium]